MPLSTNTLQQSITDTQLKEWLSNLSEHADLLTICAIYELVNRVILDDISDDGDMSKFNIIDR